MHKNSCKRKYRIISNASSITSANFNHKYYLKVFNIEQNAY